MPGIITIAAGGSRFYTGSDGGGDVNDGDEVTRTAPVSIGTWPSASGITFLGGINGPIETASNGASFSSIAPSGWAQAGSIAASVSNTRSYSGTKSLLHDMFDNDHYQFGIRFDTGSGFTRCYIRLNAFVYNPSAQTTGQHKLIRFVGSIATGGGIDDADTPRIYATRYSSGYFATNGDINPGQGGTIYTSEGGGTSGQFIRVDGVWCRLEFDFTPGTSAGAGDSRIQWRCIRLDTGALLTDGTVTGDIWSGGSRHRYVVLQMGFFNEFNAVMQSYMDRDIYIASRSSGTGALPIVEINDAQSYSACDKTKSAICEYSAQSGQDVTFLANKAAHANLTGKYVHFLDGINNPFSDTGVAL